MRGFLYSKSWHMNCFKYDVGWGDEKERWFYEEANQGIREFCYILVRIFLEAPRWCIASPHDSKRFTR